MFSKIHIAEKLKLCVVCQREDKNSSVNVEHFHVETFLSKNYYALGSARIDSFREKSAVGN